MEEFTLIQLKLPKDFNYRLESLIAKLRYNGLIMKDKTKAQFILECAEIGLAQKAKDK